MSEVDFARVKGIFGEAVELAGEARRSFLDRACAGDPALRSRVEALLEASDRPDPADPADTASVSPQAESPGARIGPYRLLQQIGEGGFGSVFMAEQRTPVHRRVALKVIKLGMDTRSVVARFEQERQALAVLDHAHIAKVFDAGVTESGRPYFVMELVTGEPITAYCDNNSLTVRERLDLFTQVCDAVQHAHSKGIIHRDIKPSNVLVSQQDGRPWARIIDFGIAKAIDRRLTEKTLFTEFQQMIGTPEYMSPEQAGGNLDVDTRSDVYSLGVLLYELLTGSTPFDPRRLRSAALGELQRIIREDDPPRPSTRLSEARDTLAGVAARRRIEPRRLGLLLRGELDWVVMKALEKDRARRYDTASAVGAEIRRYLAGEAVTAAPPTAAYRLRKFVRRHRVAVGAGSVVGAALVIGFIVASIGLVQANAARGEEKRQKEIASRQAAIALAANAFLNDMLKRADRGAEGGNPDVRVRDVLDDAALKLSGGAGPEEPEVRLSLLDTVGATYHALGLYEEAGVHLREALRQRQELLGPGDHAAIATNQYDLAMVLRDDDEIEEAEPIALAALETRRRLLGADHAESAGAGTLLATIRAARREYDGAQALYEESLASLRKDAAANRAQIADTLTDYGTTLLYKGLYAEAERAYREALGVQREVLGPEHPRITSTLNNLAWTVSRMGDFAEAERLMRECLALRRRLLGDAHPSVALTMNNLGGMLHAKGDLEAAGVALREALELRRRALGDEDSITISSIANLAALLRDKGELDEAEALNRQALALRRKVLGNDHPDVADSLANLGTVLSARGDLAGAEGLLLESLAIRRKIGQNHPDTARCLTSLAVVAGKAEKFADAENYLREALEIQRSLVGDDHPEFARVLGGLGVILLGRGNAMEAEPMLREALSLRRKHHGPRDPRTVSGEVELAWALSEIVLGPDARAPGPNGATLAAEAESLARGALPALIAADAPDPTRVALGRSILGLSIVAVEAAGAATAQSVGADQRLAEAEGLMLTGYEELQGASKEALPLRQAADRLVRLYLVWERISPGAGASAKGEDWRQRRDGGG